MSLSCNLYLFCFRDSGGDEFYTALLEGSSGDFRGLKFWGQLDVTTIDPGRLIRDSITPWGCA